MSFIDSIARRSADMALRAASSISPPAARLAGERLIRQRRFSDAEHLLADSVRRFPRHAGVLARHAFAAQADGRLGEALVRWRAACAAGPTRAMSWCRLAEVERHLGSLEAATVAIGKALALAPDHPDILVEAARLHDQSGKPDVSITFWSRLATRTQARAVWLQGYADTLIRLDRLDEAESVLRGALEREPGHQGLTAIGGLLAMRRQDWDEAFAIWSGYAARFPEDEIGKIYLSRVASVRQLADAAREERRPPLLVPVEVERVEDEALRQLMLGFEGIGADCEFGSVQRRYGAEPLGLLRWNDVTYATLSAALEARFEGLGDPTMTELVAGTIGELYVRDRRWDLGMHTFLFDHEVSRETLFPKMCRRVAYLRDKFLSDLAAGEKILVFKTDAIAVGELFRLHGLLKTFGPARLLHVRCAATAGTGGWPHAAVGEIVRIGQGLHVGYVSRMGDLYDVPYDEWVGLCRAAPETMVPAAARPA